MADRSSNDELKPRRFPLFAFSFRNGTNGFSAPKIAKRLCVSVGTIALYRSGRGRCSTATQAVIEREFGCVLDMSEGGYIADMPPPKGARRKPRRVRRAGLGTFTDEEIEQEYIRRREQKNGQPVQAAV